MRTQLAISQSSLENYCEVKQMRNVGNVVDSTLEVGLINRAFSLLLRDSRYTEQTLSKRARKMPWTLI